MERNKCRWSATTEQNLIRRPQRKMPLIRCDDQTEPVSELATPAQFTATFAKVHGSFSTPAPDLNGQLKLH